MAFNPTSPITGSTQSGLTSPTYTLTTDTPMNAFGKQYAVTSLGGTQTGVLAHSAQYPFILAFYRPANVKSLTYKGDGTLKEVPVNRYTAITKKGVTPALNAPPGAVLLRTEISVPAGADNYDSLNVKAALSAHIGMLQQASAGIGDTIVSGLI